MTSYSEWGNTIYLNLDISGKWENPTREDICSFISDEILKFYGIEHEVEFDKITRNRLEPGIILQYSFVGKYADDSLYGYVYRISDMDLSQTPTSTYIMSRPHFQQMTSRENCHDLSDLQTIYLGMKYDQLKDPFEDKGWDIIKSILLKKIKKTLKLPMDGSYPELQHVKFKLDKLRQFNQNKYNFIVKRLKRSGKTLSNFQEASTIWDKQYKKTLNLDRNKASMELRIDLAMSGLNDDIV